MRGRIRRVAAAGLFLLFAMMLVCLAPVPQTTMSGVGTKRSVPAENEIEHRDSARLRGTITARRKRYRPPHPRNVLPHELLGSRSAAAPQAGPQCPGANKPVHPVVRWTHSPPSLQVFRR